MMAGRANLSGNLDLSAVQLFSKGKYARNSHAGSRLLQGGSQCKVVGKLAGRERRIGGREKKFATFAKKKQRGSRRRKQKGSSGLFDGARETGLMRRGEKGGGHDFMGGLEHVGGRRGNLRIGRRRD